MIQLQDLAPSIPASDPKTRVSPIPTPPNLPFYRPLGRTELQVSALGIGGGGGISSEDTLYAFDQGINYFFFSSDLHHFLYRSMANGLKQLCSRGSKERENVVLATVTYNKSPEMAIAALFDQFSELNIDYIDVFFWGWVGHEDGPALNRCLNLSHDLRGPNSVYQRTVEEMFGASEKLKQMGAVRYIGASFHDLDLAQQWADSSLIDVLMVRHNIAHRSAQSKIFHPLAHAPQRPGVVTFKSSGSHTGPLWVSPQNLPSAMTVPSVPDLYRYSLSQPSVDVCLTGVENRDQIDAAIAGLQQGPLSLAEQAELNAYGDRHRQPMLTSN